MNKKTDIDVIINNKRYTLSGYESEEYLQKIAGFINNKIADLSRNEGFKHFDTEHKNVLTQLNLADEYFRVKEQLEDAEADSDAKSNEIYTLKHEIISLKGKIDSLNAEIEELKQENIEEQKKIVKLEAKLEHVK